VAGDAVPAAATRSMAELDDMWDDPADQTGNPQQLEQPPPLTS
jgi:hypothetical protein